MSGIVLRARNMV